MVRLSTVPEQFRWKLNYLTMVFLLVSQRVSKLPNHLHIMIAIRLSNSDRFSDDFFSSFFWIIIFIIIIIRTKFRRLFTFVCKMITMRPANRLCRCFMSVIPMLLGLSSLLQLRCIHRYLLPTPGWRRNSVLLGIEKSRKTIQFECRLKKTNGKEKTKKKRLPFAIKCNSLSFVNNVYLHFRF